MHMLVDLFILVAPNVILGPLVHNTPIRRIVGTASVIVKIVRSSLYKLILRWHQRQHCETVNI